MGREGEEEGKREGKKRVKQGVLEKKYVFFFQAEDGIRDKGM